MERTASGLIRKLQWGLVPGQPCLTIQVGSRAMGKDNYIISEIVEDKNTFLTQGCFEYLVYVVKDGKKDGKMFWKRFRTAPDVVEYYLLDEENLYV